jgi:hypothetical protein
MALAEQTILVVAQGGQLTGPLAQRLERPGLRLVVGEGAAPTVRALAALAIDRMSVLQTRVDTHLGLRNLLAAAREQSERIQACVCLLSPADAEGAERSAAEAVAGMLTQAGLAADVFLGLHQQQVTQRRADALTAAERRETAGRLVFVLILPVDAGAEHATLASGALEGLVHSLTARAARADVRVAGLVLADWDLDRRAPVGAGEEPVLKPSLDDVLDVAASLILGQTGPLTGQVLRLLPG